MSTSDAPPQFCEQCGTRLQADQRFCESCGAAVSSTRVEKSIKTPNRETVVAPPESPAPLSTPAPVASPAQSDGNAKLIPILVVIFSVLALSVIGGLAWWWFSQNESIFSGFESPTVSTSTSNTPSPAQQKGTSLLNRGDFSGGAPTGIEGDGTLVQTPDGTGNQAWQLNGPDDIGIFLPLDPTPGEGSIRVRCRVLVPGSTATDAQLGGVRIRFRFSDRYESSGIADNVLQAMDDWQIITHTFEDTGSGPYQLGIEAFGFTGLLYLDDLEVHLDAESFGTNTPKSSAAELPVNTAGLAAPEESPNASELEKWVVDQPWFQRLATSMPSGVTLSIAETDDAFEGWTSFEIREHHSAESGFDPNVAPRVGLFEVSPKRDGVAWFDPVSADWQPIEDFIASRGL